MRPSLAQRTRGRAGIEQIRKYVVDVLAGHWRRIGRWWKSWKNRKNWESWKRVEDLE
jgi:hypothetical protein